MAPVGGGISPIPDYYKIGEDGQLIPDHSGTVANYANSPMPVLETVGIETYAGNAINADRSVSSDYAVGLGQQAGSTLPAVPAGV